ncbi:hypothetical protein TrST_g10177 [Triparma strigata]|uniref:Uncharacterized protein n=1 Tax=Triparma strigata TaxID=1606541 RepID=A0A9W7DRN1_9STRA|nr:hypothetical protein TrST_g10177 [Triparma strigata]
MSTPMSDKELSAILLSHIYTLTPLNATMHEIMFSSTSPAVLNNHAVLLEATSGSGLPSPSSYIRHLRTLSTPNSKYTRTLTTLQKTLYESLRGDGPIFHYALAKALQPIPAEYWEEGVKEIMGLLTEGMGISNNEEERRKGERMVEEFVKYVEGVEGGGREKEKEEQEEIKTIEKLDMVLRQLKEVGSEHNGQHLPTRGGNIDRTGAASDTVELRYELESLREEMRRLTSSISSGGGERATQNFATPIQSQTQTQPQVQQKYEEKVEVRRLFVSDEAKAKDEVRTSPPVAGTSSTPSSTPTEPETSTSSTSSTSSTTTPEPPPPPPPPPQPPQPSLPLYIPTPVTPPPPSPQITSLLNVANAYIDKSQFHPAVLQFKKIVKRSPHHLGARIGLATFLEKQGKECIKEWTEAMKVAKDVGDEKVGLLWEKVKSLIVDGGSSEDIEVVKRACWSEGMVAEVEGVKVLEGGEKRRKGGGGGGIMQGGGLGSGSSVFQQQQEQGQEQGAQDDPLNKLEEGAKIYEQR